MSSEIFNCLFREHVDAFRAAFSSISTSVFYDPQSKRIRHTGEYGTYRESIVRDFFKFIVPRSLDISTGFVITSNNDISTQCDILIFDSRMTPLFQEGERQRFFPVESLFCIGEVKSTLTKNELGDALNKLAEVKALGERMINPLIIRKISQGPFDPVNDAYDLVPSILVCQKLNFKLDNIHKEIDGLYDSKYEHRHKHNMILSIEDGLLCYANGERSIPYPRINGVNMKHCFTYPGENNYIHFNVFGAYMFMLTANKSLFYPEFADYLGEPTGGFSRIQA